MLLLTFIANFWWLFPIVCILGIIGAFGFGVLGAEKENGWILGLAFGSGVMAWISGWLSFISFFINLIIFIVKATK